MTWSFATTVSMASTTKSTPCAGTSAAALASS